MEAKSKSTKIMTTAYLKDLIYVVARRTFDRMTEADAENVEKQFERLLLLSKRDFTLYITIKAIINDEMQLVERIN